MDSWKLQQIALISNELSETMDDISVEESLIMMLHMYKLYVDYQEDELAKSTGKAIVLGMIFGAAIVGLAAFVIVLLKGVM